MKFNENYFPVWLEVVRQQLISLTIAGKGKRINIFKPDLVLDDRSWRVYFEDGLLPHQSVSADLELPWFETKQHRIL